MSKIIGVTVGTPTSPAKMAEELNIVDSLVVTIDLTTMTASHRPVDVYEAMESGKPFALVADGIVMDIESITANSVKFYHNAIVPPNITRVAYELDARKRITQIAYEQAKTVPHYSISDSGKSLQVVNGLAAWVRNPNSVKTVNGTAPDENGNVDIEIPEGMNGEDGKSIFCTTQQTKATESADFHMQFIQNGDREVSVGDLILSSSGWLYRVTKISGTIVTASFMSILKGEKGDSASVEDVLSALPTVTNVTVTDHGDGRFTQVKEFSDGSEEVTEVTVDENGIPIKLTVNGVEIPYFFRYGGDDPVIPEEPEIPDDPVIPDEPSSKLVGYSYNGVVLPDINTVWTDELKQTYPYAYINLMPESQYHPDTYILYLTDKKFYFTKEDYLMGMKTTYNSYRCPVVDFPEFGNANQWNINSENKYTDASRIGVSANWANYEILNLDGTVYLAASEPIPVYE